MAYERLNLKNGTTLDESHVKHLEDGIVAAHEAAGAATGGSSPIKYVESLDKSNMKNLRDLETGSHVLYGYFKPYAGAPNTLTIDTQLVNVVRKNEGSHILIFSTLNSIVNFLEIMVDSTNERGFTYTRTDIDMLDLHALIEKVGNLEGLTTTEKGSLVAAINEVAAKQGSGGNAEDGFSPIAKVEQTATGAVVSITDKTGTTTATITNGKDGKEGAPADWNAVEGQAGHILNRTHYTERVTTDIVPEKEITLEIGLGVPTYLEAGFWDFSIGETYVVTYDGVEYECVAYESSFSGMATISIGNEAVYGGSNNTGEPFAAAVIPVFGNSGVIGIEAGTHTIHIVGVKDVVHPLDDRYINTEVKLALVDGSCDKTWKEIVAALDAKKTLVAERRSITGGASSIQSLRLTYCIYTEDYGTLVFQGFDGYDVGARGKETVMKQIGFVVEAYDGEIVSVEAFESYFDPAEGLRNPYALTINGTSYDGSKAVNITIEAGNADSIPDYVRTEAERVAKVVQSRQNANTITFLACSDIHYSSPDNVTPIATAENIHEATLHMGQAMGIIRSLVHIDFAAMFGDMVRDNGEANAEEVQNEVRFVNSCLHEGFSGIPACRLEGNHDEAYESGVGLSAGQVFANIHAWNVGAVYGDRSVGYCYRDFEDVKLRVICLNTSEGSGSSIRVSAEQNAWLAEVLDISAKGDGWCSMVLSHHPLDFSRNGGVDPISTVKTAAGLIGTFHGHIHNFLVDYITGTEVKRIAIPNAVRDQENSYTTNNGVNFAESTKYPKTAGTAQDTSFCVVTIDLAAQKIYADHYGAGYSREIDYTYKSAGSGYTNLVTTSIDPATGEVYNGEGKGYKNDVYGSDAGEGSTPDTDCVLTGLIAYGNGRTDPIYIKGADITTASHCRILGFDANRNCYFQAAAGEAIRTYFTVETLGDKYYKVTPIISAITGQTDYLRFSLIGEGENLIITIGEPIE